MSISDWRSDVCSSDLLKLAGFFPCPRPAYATLRRRSLVPVPDWERYAIHFRKISDLTSRIYLLLDKVRMKGLIPAGGDVGDAVEELLRSDDDEILIPEIGRAPSELQSLMRISYAVFCLKKK